MGELEESKCEYSTLLIVDDNDSNIFVLQSYADISKVKCDIVWSFF